MGACVSTANAPTNIPSGRRLYARRTRKSRSISTMREAPSMKTVNDANCVSFSGFVQVDYDKATNKSYLVTQLHYSQVDANGVCQDEYFDSVSLLDDNSDDDDFSSVIDGSFVSEVLESKVINIANMAAYIPTQSVSDFWTDTSDKYITRPQLHHYTCIVDLLGRAGKLREALCMILKMKCCHDSRIWGALLAAARTYMDRKIGGYAAKRLLELEPRNVGYHVVLGNMKASSEQWDEVEAVRRRVNEMDLKKVPGWSCIEAKGQIVGFVSSDTSHPQFRDICGILGFLKIQMQNSDPSR